ncbi:DUF2970 domain-containing protein [Shewanella basaltis]|uniref:DUF2970 domain-containing protein n=1 Tax=Shewanella basaltis TaxID=472183 RepID=UPI00200F14FD|nr:DUF2970 domain-containing protein [Shewanella basaltis]MCL1112058.1 DUF2970 domain-containing protein [Shewanella basaltis]
MSFRRVLGSTIAAFFGVQTDQNRRQDFQSRSALPFIIMGIVLALSFVLTLLFIVNLVLS